MDAGKIPFDSLRAVHFVGIGGSGMSSLAELAVRLGIRVTGSDVAESRVTRRLAGKGITVQIGHSVENLGNVDALVYSSAIDPENPELLEAEVRRIPLLHRSDLLNLMMGSRTGITIAGTHGKSTVTGMVGTILRAGGEAPSLAAGVEIPGLGGSSLAGKGRFFVAEADESDRSFLKYHPYAGIVTCVDNDHLNNYRDIEDIGEAFLHHLNAISREGASVCCLDDPILRTLLPRVQGRVITYGLSGEADYFASGIELRGMGSSFTLHGPSGRLGSVELALPGEVNIQNALGASALCLFLGVGFEAVKTGLASFRGVSRRMEFKGEADGIRLVDDYAHHPTEIRAALKALRNLGGRMIVVFQPHRYTRTEHLLPDLAGAFGEADLLLLLPVYAAGETPSREGLSEELALEIKRRRQVIYFTSGNSAADYLVENSVAGDLVVTMGAGDVWKTGEIFLEKKKR